MILSEISDSEYFKETWCHTVFACMKQKYKLECGNEEKLGKPKPS